MSEIDYRDIDDRDDELARLRSENERLAAENDRLREALEPFAKEAIAWIGYVSFAYINAEDNDRSTLTVAHLMAARQALKGDQSNDG